MIVLCTIALKKAKDWYKSKKFNHKRLDVALRLFFGYFRLSRHCLDVLCTLDYAIQCHQRQVCVTKQMILLVHRIDSNAMETLEVYKKANSQYLNI